MRVLTDTTSTSQGGHGRVAHSRVPGMYAQHPTQNQNWWWTAHPAAH